MSVPGIFAPAELDGKLLADGGLVRNLGVDVARDFQPDQRAGKARLGIVG